MAPSPRHLTTEDSLPPLKPGVLRLYSMKFCPFAERARLVLFAKEIQHEVINVNTLNKPSWFKEKNPFQTVPVLEQDEKIVYESLIICTYLEELFPEKNTLVPKDPFQKAKDAMLLDFHGGKVIPSFFGAHNGANQEKVEALRAGLTRLDEELKLRGTNFFYGSKPGYIDYMLWPIFPRFKSNGAFGEGQGIPTTMAALSAWVDRMMTDKAVQSTIHPDSAYGEISRSNHKDPTLFDKVKTPN